MPWPFDLGFMQRALIAGVIVGASAPLIGTFIVHRRMSLMGDGIGHVAFAGVAAGLLLDVWPVWSALVVAVAAALLIEALRRTGTVPGDLALAVMFYAGLAGGVVLASAADSLDAGINAFLFGAILSVSWSELWVIGALGSVIVAAVALGGRALFAVVVDEEAARVSGLPVDALNAMLAVLVAATVVIAMRAVGLLLVAALMVLPVGASQALARSFRTTMVGAAAVGALSVVLGLTGSRAWGLAPGGTIVLVAAGLFVLSASATRARRGPPRLAVVPVGGQDRKSR